MKFGRAMCGIKAIRGDQGGPSGDIFRDANVRHQAAERSPDSLLPKCRRHVWHKPAA